MLIEQGAGLAAGSIACKIMGSKSKSKPTTSSPVTKALNANLTNSTFGFLSAAGWKGKSPASASKSVNLQPDLDLLSGFAFLSFASLDELETHIEHNEATSAAISVNVGKKRKAEGSSKRQGDNYGLSVPPSKKKAATTAKKKPPKQLTSTLATDAAAKPKQGSLTDSSPKPKTDQISSVGTTLDDCELSQSTPIDISDNGSEINEQSSPNVFSEISLLCSETVDLGDDEDLPQEVYKRPAKAVADSTNRDVGSGEPDMPTAQVNQIEGAVEGTGTSTDPIPKKKKKKKKRKNEHCDQTSQTKFRIKKKKSESKVSEGTSNVLLDESKNDPFPDHLLQDVENLHGRGGNGEDGNKSQVKHLLSRPKTENITCARTTVYQGYTKGSSFKSKLNALESSSGDRSISSTCDTSELSEAKTVENISLDGRTPQNKDQETDVGDESTSASVLSDLSDHSSDLEMFIDRCGCFLLNNKIEKVEKEELEMGDEVVDVDIESVGKETRKNFLVVSGIEAGHFSYHPGVTKDGTIDTSIQALPNEIDIFLQCARMQEGEMIKIINPDDSDELHSHFTQNNGRNPDTVKAVRSATERKRRHHLGDLFNDMKLEVFTDLVDADLYFSKQAILSKGISTIEELQKESKELNNTKKKLMKTNKMLKEKRNMLMFGKESVDADSAKVEAIFQQLNIKVDDEETSKTEENSNSCQDVAVDAASESKVVVEPCVKGRPRAKKTLLSPLVSTNKPVLTSKDGLSTTATNLPQKATTQIPLEAPKEIVGTAASSSQTFPSLNISNVSCGVQTQEDSKDSPKPSTLGNPPLTQSLPSESGTAKSKPINESTSQEGPKPSLVKILPKPTILQLHPTQQKVIMDTLGQVKQPSSDKIICNLSRLSTMQNPSSSSSICFIRSGQLMTSLDSKNVTHIKITNDEPKNVDRASCSTSTASASMSRQQVSSTTTATTHVPRFLTLGVAKMPEPPGTSSVQPSQKHPEKTMLVSKIPLKSTTTQVTSTPTAKNMPGFLTFTPATSSVQTSQKCPENTLLVSPIPLKSATTNVSSMTTTTTSVPGFLTLGVPKMPEAPGISSVQTSQKCPEKTLLVSQNPLKSTTTQVSSTAATANKTGFLSLGVAKMPEVPGTSSIQTSQKHSENTRLLVSQIPLKTATTQVSGMTTATNLPGFLTFSVAKMPAAPGTSSVQTSQRRPENTLLVSQIPLKSTTTPTVIFAGKPLGMLTTSTGPLQSPGQTSSEMTMRALASLSQLQANRPPLVGTGAKPGVLNESPVAGILSGLKNVVMKVVPRQPEVQSTRSAPPSLPTATGTTAVKGAMSSQVSVASSQGKQPTTSRTISVIPIISVPTSSSLNKSFTTSALNQPLPSSGVSAKVDVDTSAPLIKPCVDPFNLVPKQPVASDPPIILEPNLPSTSSSASLDLESEAEKELDNLTSSESPSSISDDIFKDEPSTSTVLTQEMLKIPGMADVPLPKLPDVFENLDDLDNTIETKSPKTLCDTEERKPEGSDTCNVSSSSQSSEIQTDVPSLPLPSSIAAKISTSPLKVEIKDFRKGKPFQSDVE